MRPEFAVLGSVYHCSWGFEMDVSGVNLRSVEGDLVDGLRNDGSGDSKNRRSVDGSFEGYNWKIYMSFMHEISS
jgi:hypothetical protein